MKTNCFIRRFWCAVFLLPWVIGPLPSSAADIKTALQTGLFEEEANRNLDAAIRAYQAVIDEHSEQRQFVATALFRLGECFRKLGKTNDAVAHYQRLLRDFSDQETLVNLSRQNLAGLLPGSAPARGPAAAATTPVPDRRDQVRNRQILALIASRPVEEVRKVLPTLLPDELLADLLRQISSVEIRLAKLSVSLAPEHPEMLAEKAMLGNLYTQIVSRIDGIRQAMELEVNAYETANNPSASPAAAAATDEEQKEIRRIQALIKNSPDLINAPVDPNMGITPLHQAANAGQLVVTRFLLQNQANVNARSKQSETPLHLAARNGHLNMVLLLLSSGAEVNAQSADGFTPLHLAVELGFKAVVATLLNQKADPNLESKPSQQTRGRLHSGQPPLHTAIKSQQRDIIDLLLANGAEVDRKNQDGRTTLHMAADAGNVELSTLLIARQAQVNARDSAGMTPLHLAASAGSIDVVNVLLAHQAEATLKTRGGETPLHLVAWREQPGSAQVAKVLLAQGVDPNQRNDEGNTPLLQAVRTGWIEMAAVLLEAKADPNLASTQQPYFGNAPLHIATVKNLGPLVELLLKHGADVNARLSSEAVLHSLNIQEKFIPDSTALVLAAYKGFPEIAQLLLKSRADPNLRNESGHTALHIAIFTKNTALVDVLLQGGANVEAKEEQGATPLNLSIQYGAENIVKLLLAHHANVNAASTSGMVPLHSAVAYDQRGILNLLLAAKADVNLPDAQGRTALDYVKDGVRANLGQSVVPSIPLRAAPMLPMPGGLGPPGGRPLPYASAPTAISPRRAELADALRAQGALDWAPRPGQITLVRRSNGAIQSVFQQDTNGFNRYTLLEALTATDWGQASLWKFPDLANLKILRRQPTNGTIQELTVDLTLLTTNDCSANVALEWGDLVDIPERIHKLNDSWMGLPAPFADALVHCLQRKVQLVIAGESAELTLEPLAPAKELVPPVVFALPPGLAAPQPRSQLDGFRLITVIRSGNLLRTSSDLSRVKVRRSDPASGPAREYLIDHTQTLPPQEDLWLRHGDIIEVPDKGKASMESDGAPEKPKTDRVP